MRRLALRARRPRGDEGISLMEVIVALGLLSVVMLALLSSSVFAVKATVSARLNQQAADYLNQALESARSLDYADAVLRTSELSGDPAIVTVGGVNMYDAGAGLETVDSSSTGTVRPQSETADTDNGTYTTRRYVTIPAGTPLNPQGLPSVRRLTVVVSWESGGQTRTRRSSTLMTQTRRGLPLPIFTWKYNGPAPITSNVPHWVKNPGNDVSYGLVLNNLGARDAWTVSADTPGWSFYRDANQDGLWSGDTATEPALTSNSTGLIEPGSAPFYLVAFRTIGSSESGTTTTVFTATSEAVTTVAKTVTTRLTVQTGAVADPVPVTPTTPTGPCAPATEPTINSSGTPPTATTQGSHTLRTVYFYTSGGFQDTTAVDTNSSGLDASPLSSTSRLCNWSTDLHADQPGRYLGAPTDPAVLGRAAQFRFQPPSAAEDDFRGEPVVSVWVQCPVGTPTLTVSLLRTDTGATAASATMSTSGCTSTSFTRFSVQLPTVNFKLGSLSDALVVRLTSSAPVRLGYSTATTPASLTIGMK